MSSALIGLQITLEFACSCRRRRPCLSLAPPPPAPADLPLEEKAAFLKETRHAFGRTALVLRCAHCARCARCARCAGARPLPLS